MVGVVSYVVISVKMGFGDFAFSLVGRGVLRFWEGWYRKTRSKLWVFCGFGGICGILGVDIIECGGVWSCYRNAILVNGR